MVPPFVSSRAATAQGTLIALNLLSLGYRYIINRVILSSVPESAARRARPYKALSSICHPTASELIVGKLEAIHAAE
jgi:hypothetical protein